MANSFLSFSATNEFEIYHYGSTQSRVAFIAINAYIAIVIALALAIYTWQIHLRAPDMEIKANRQDF